MSGLFNKLTGHNQTPHTSTSPARGDATKLTKDSGHVHTATALHQTNRSTTETGSTKEAAAKSNIYTQQEATGLTGDDSMTRSEEQLRVETTRVPTGKAELNKYVTTEHVEQSVPIQRERIVIEREPINASNIDDAVKGPSISEAHYETTLSEDRVKVSKQTVPIERIRLVKQTESNVQNVSADLRKEHVDFTHSSLGSDKVDHSTLSESNINAATRQARKEEEC